MVDSAVLWKKGFVSWVPKESVTMQVEVIFQAIPEGDDRTIDSS
jgi:hypothetical protein